MSPRFRLQRRCRCGHSRVTHRHYRRGTDCSSCPCQKWRTGRLRLVRYQCQKTGPETGFLRELPGGFGGGPRFSGGAEWLRIRENF